EPDVSNRHIHFSKDRERIFQTESHTFQYRPDHVAPGMRCSQPDERSARIRIQIWRALSHQIWRPQEAIRTSGNRIRLSCEPFVWIAAVIRPSRVKLIAKPSQR